MVKDHLMILTGLLLAALIAAGCAMFNGSNRGMYEGGRGIQNTVDRK